MREGTAAVYTTNILLDLVKSRYDLKSDYKLAKFLEVDPSRISNYRNGRSHLDEKLALVVAKLLDFNAGAVLAWTQAERTKCPDARIAWLNAAKVLNDCSGLNYKEGGSNQS